MRFLLDTNILIPLENSQIVPGESVTNFVRLANENGHQLLYHPASEDDVNRDSNILRRGQTMERLKQYVRLKDPPFVRGILHKQIQMILRITKYFTPSNARRRMRW